ncbi:hypothetical protein K2X30_03015 [bacterium]|jgi:hypothetical protein|nr:hypothetical protein [bacterium]
MKTFIAVAGLVFGFGLVAGPQASACMGEAEYFSVIIPQMPQRQAGKLFVGDVLKLNASDDIVTDANVERIGQDSLKWVYYSVAKAGTVSFVRKYDKKKVTYSYTATEPSRARDGGCNDHRGK